MRKQFCDICGDPAADEYAVRFLEHPIPMAGSAVARITVRVTFGFMGHPTGFGGPPDLCRCCLEGLLTRLRDLNHHDQTPAPQAVEQDV